MSNFLLIIPARLESVRFPNKLLKKINGIEVIKYVWLRCLKAVQKKNVYVATGNKEIISFCKNNNINYIKTSKNCVTGTDRILEVAKKIKKDFYINVQGDEILVNPLSIKKVINLCTKYKNKFIINAYTKVQSTKEFFNKNVPKVVINKDNNLMYISRAGIPSNKKNIYIKGLKQVCIYAYPRDILLKIKKNKKTYLESIEDIEILRFLENNILVKMAKVVGSEISIDIPKDLILAKKIILRKKNNVV